MTPRGVDTKSHVASFMFGLEANLLVQAAHVSCSDSQYLANVFIYLPLVPVFERL